MKSPSTFALLLSLVTTPMLSAAAPDRTRSFDKDWKFLRGDEPGAEAVAFNDSKWRTLDVPHDWSIEDLPPKATDVPELEAVRGEWRFKPGDDPKWNAREFDDSGWQKVTLPDIWEKHGQSTGDNVFGWFRRTLEIPAAWKGRELDLLLGKIDDVDETWVNGQRVGGTGSFPPDFRWADQEQRRYRVPATLTRGGTVTIAVRVFDGANHGGIHEAGLKSARVGPFDQADTENRHFTGNTVGGIGWYRKHFVVKETGKRVAVRFDGVYMNPELWINGRRLGEHPHGYTGFEFDLTPHLKPAGQTNVLAVRVRNEGKNTRWYSGSGIYRHVWLTVTDPVHVPAGGVFVTTPEVSKEKSVVRVSGEITNAGRSDVTAGIRVRVHGADGEPVGAAEGTLHLPAGKTLTSEQTVEVPMPKLWSPDSPNLYAAEVEVVVAGKTADAVATSFGIRKIEFDGTHGFLLNGEPVLLKGGNVHHDNGPLGAAAIDRAEERKVGLLRANGFNAIRSAHNPPSPALVDACDRLGMFLIVEAFDQWNESKENNQQGYQRFFKDWFERDIASMVRRDRNHPSVIMWSIGNEIPEQFRAGDIGNRLREAVRSHDATRPVTAAICNDWGEVTRNWDKLSDPAFPHLDVAGYNYLPEKYASDHARHPERVMYGAESYPKDALLYWSLAEEHPYVIGDFVWTAMDYLGEAGIGHSLLSNEKNNFFMPWPWFNAWCGDLDLCGFKKPQSLYRDVVWHQSMIEMAVHAPIPAGLTETVSGWGWPDESHSWNWTGHEGTPLAVSVYSRCETVRLELNGKVVGEKPVSVATKLTTRFDVPYAPGELKAYGLMNGNVVAETTLRTTGAPAKLKLTADRSEIRADRNDLSYVTVEVVDAHGRRVPDAEIPLRFSANGVGELAGNASANPKEPASFRAPERKTFQGRCLAILRPKGGAGEVFLRAEGQGLEPVAISIRVR